MLNGHENPIHMTPPGIMLERWHTSSASVEKLTWSFYADVRSGFAFLHSLLETDGVFMDLWRGRQEPRLGFHHVWTGGIR